MQSTPYIGRFAPSPTGYLHLGSLTSAVCSYLQAKSQQGKWLVRIEDIDTPRIVKGSADIQLRQLEDFGFEWDSEVVYQSQRLSIYLDIVNQLLERDQAYYCECTRKSLNQTAERSDHGIIYPRICRSKQLTHTSHLSVRFKTTDADIEFKDRVYQSQLFNIQNITSDWVLKRADGIFSYHLAVVVDDYQQGISEVVRGADILPLTALHIDLQHALNIPQPLYFHHPLVMYQQQKLSKQNMAESISNMNKIVALNAALSALGQSQITQIENLIDFWKQAVKAWNPKTIPLNNYCLSN